MHKVFIVEDEIVVRESIRENFPWEKYGFTFAGEAADGEMALPMIEETQPHIVITDIRMPFLDGLSLSRILRQNMPWIKIVILTGHDEFEYARQAVSLGVTDYILKPIGTEDLLHILTKVSDRLQQEEMERQNVDRLRSLLQDSTDHMAERFLNDLVVGALTSAQVIENASKYKLNLVENLYAVILLKAECNQTEAEFRYLDYLKADSIIRQLMENNPDILSFKRNLKETVLIVKGKDGQEISNSCYRLGHAVKVEVEEKTSCRLAVNIGGVKERIQGISESFKEAEETRGFQFFFGDNKIVGVEDTRLSNLHSDSQFPFERDSLIEFLRQGQVSDLDDFIKNQLVLGLKLDSVPFLYAFTYFNITREATRFISGLGGNPVEYLKLENISPEGMLKLDMDENTFLKDVAQLLQAVLKYREDKKLNRYSEIIQKAKSYIDENFSQSDLSLGLVAEQVNISACHFSTVFSQESGTTFIEYLTDLRVKHAKELLLSTGLISSEIAYKVGYNDAHYFCHIFKKATGLTPGGFRKGGRVLV